MVPAMMGFFFCLEWTLMIKGLHMMCLYIEYTLGYMYLVFLQINLGLQLYHMRLYILDPPLG